MGFYVEIGTAKGKAKAIAEQYNGDIYSGPPDYEKATEEGLGIIVVVDNGIFEAAGFAFSPEEYEAFTRPGDERPKQFVLIDREAAELVSGYRKG